MKVKDLLDSPDKWCEDDFARHADGNVVEPDDPTACQWCLAGAVIKCYADENERERILCLIAGKIEEDFNGDNAVGSVICWNDECATFQDVRELTLELDI